LNDTLYRNATILTMDDARTTATGLWVRGDRVQAVGRAEDLRSMAGPNAAVVDLGGATVLPGLIDAHCHISVVAYLLSGCDVSQPGCPDIASIQRALREQAAKTPEGAWVTGGGFVEYKLAEKRYPTRWDLDEAVPDRPAIIYHTSYHGCVVNSKGLFEAGYGDDSPDPPGGLLLRNEEGVCNGVILEAPSFALLNRNLDAGFGLMTPAGRADAVARACAYYAALGVTSVMDAGISTSNMSFRAFRDAEVAGKLGVRVSAAINQASAGWLVDGGITSGFGSDRLQVSGVKVFSDGGMSSRTAAVEEPYPVPPFGTGILFHEKPELIEIIRRYNDAGLQVCVHAQGDRAIRTVLEAFEEVIGRGSGNPLRHRIEHGGCLYPDLLPLAAAVGIHVVSQPAFFSLLGDGFFEAFGDDSAQQLYAFASIRKAGLKVGGSSDSPVITAAALLGIRDAVARTTASGRSIGAGERLTVDDALSIYTRDAAWLIHAERDRGTLEAGKLADFVALAENPLEVEPDLIADIRVLRTVVGGETVFEA
jgi:predicted amidohydrolase YtcJ